MQKLSVINRQVRTRSRSDEVKTRNFPLSSVSRTMPLNGQLIKLASYFVNGKDWIQTRIKFNSIKYL